MSTMTVASWSAQAACATADPDLFFPERGTPQERIAEAKQICAGCPVKQACLEDAFRRNDPDALCGGLTAEERGNVLRAGQRRLRAVGRASARELAVRHGAHMLACLVQWQMSVADVAVELGSTPRAVHGAFRIVVPAKPGRRDGARASAIERLLATSKERMQTMASLGYTHESIAEALETSQSIVSASLAVLKQRDDAVRRLSRDGSDGLQRLQDEELRVRQEAGVGLSVGDVIELAGPKILRLYGEGTPLRAAASELGLCRETVRLAYQQMTQVRPVKKNLAKNQMGAAA